MDNVSFHKKHNDQRFCFIHPYSPEYNPVEYCFSKIKNCFRKLIIKRIYVEDSIKYSISLINKENIINYFNHVKNILSF
jgi:transposase